MLLSVVGHRSGQFVYPKYTTRRPCAAPRIVKGLPSWATSGNVTAATFGAGVTTAPFKDAGFEAHAASVLDATRRPVNAPDAAHRDLVFTVDMSCLVGWSSGSSEIVT